MVAYDYEVLQSKEAFTVEMKDTVDKLPLALTFSTQLNDFIMQLLILNPKDRLKTRTICMHPWLGGAFDILLAPRMAFKPKSTRRPSIADIVSHSESTPNIMPVRSTSMPKEKGRLEELLMKGQGSFENYPDSGSVAVISNDNQDLGSGSGNLIASRSLDQSLGYFKDKSPKHGTLVTLDADDYLLKSSRGLAAGIYGSQSNPVLSNLKISSPSSSGKSILSVAPSGEDNVSEKSHDTASPLRRYRKNCRGSFNLNVGDHFESGNMLRRVSEGEAPLRIGSMILPPICTDLISPRNRPIVVAYGANDEDESGEMDSLSAAAKEMVSVAHNSYQKDAACRQGAGISQATSNQVDADSSSVANSCNSGGSGSGVSFFGYGNRQYLAPRGSFANEFAAPRGSFVNDFSAPRGSFANECNGPRGSFANECTAPRGSFANECCGTRGSFATELSAVRNMFAVNTRGSFASDAGEVQNNNVNGICLPSEHKAQGQREVFTANRPSSLASIASSVTISPSANTPLTTPSPSVGPATPSLRNIDEESTDEISSIDELRNFLIAGSFSFPGPNASKNKK